MEIKMDRDANAQRRWKSNDNRPNLFQWLLIISLGVFIGNIATMGVERAITYWEIYQVAKAMEAETAKMKLKMYEQGKINRENARIREIENQQKHAALRQALETCKFWQEQLAKSNTAEHKAHRDKACELVGKFR